MTPMLKVLNLNLELIALIDDYESFFYEEKYADIGECTLTISVHSEHFKSIQKNTILYLSTYESWYIEEITISNDIATIKALSLNFILGHRITVPPENKTHLAYTKTLTSKIILNLIKASLVKSPVKERNINLILPASSSLGHKIDYQSRYRNLLEEVKALANYSALGFALGVDIKNKHFVFKVYNGRDLTQEVIFSEDYCNIINLQLVDSNLSYKNHVYVAGQGQGLERVIIEAFEDKVKSNWLRREEIKDSRDKANLEELYLEGDKILIEQCEKTSIDATISSVEDVVVGDTIMIITKKYGYKFVQRVIQKDVEYTIQHGKTVHIIVGSPKPTLSFDDTTIIE